MSVLRNPPPCSFFDPGALIDMLPRPSKVLRAANKRLREDANTLEATIEALTREVHQLRPEADR